MRENEVAQFEKELVDIRAKIAQEEQDRNAQNAVDHSRPDAFAIAFLLLFLVYYCAGSWRFPVTVCVLLGLCVCSSWLHFRLLDTQ